MTGMHGQAAASTGIVLVQPGWQVYSKDGELLGEVIAANERLVHLRLEGADERSLELGTDTIMEQDEAQLRVRISLTSKELRAG